MEFSRDCSSKSISQHCCGAAVDSWEGVLAIVVPGMSVSPGTHTNSALHFLLVIFQRRSRRGRCCGRSRLSSEQLSRRHGPRRGGERAPLPAPPFGFGFGFEQQQRRRDGRRRKDGMSWCGVVFGVFVEHTSSTRCCGNFPATAIDESVGFHLKCVQRASVRFECHHIVPRAKGREGEEAGATLRARWPPFPEGFPYMYPNPRKQHPKYQGIQAIPRQIGNTDGFNVCWCQTRKVQSEQSVP